MQTSFERFLAAAGILLAALTGPPALAAPATPPSGGTISVEPPVDATVDRAPPAYSEAVREALGRKGFTILDDPGHSASVAELSLSRTDVGAGSAKVPSGRAAVAPGGFGGVGAGVTVPLGAKRSQAVRLVRCQLHVAIRRRGDRTIVWRGAAVTVRAVGTEQGADAVVARTLSDAILAGYPAESRNVVSVP